MSHDTLVQDDRFPVPLAQMCPPHEWYNMHAEHPHGTFAPRAPVHASRPCSMESECLLGCHRHRTILVVPKTKRCSNRLNSHHRRVQRHQQVRTSCLNVSRVAAHVGLHQMSVLARQTPLHAIHLCNDVWRINAEQVAEHVLGLVCLSSAKQSRSRLGAQLPARPTSRHDDPHVAAQLHHNALKEADAGICSGESPSPLQMPLEGGTLRRTQPR